MEPIKFSVVENFVLTNKICKEEELIKGLTGEKMKSKIEPLRLLIQQGEKEKADHLKMKLPAILASGIFKGGRSADKLKDYSQVICLDLDKLQSEKVIPIKDIIAN